MNETSHLASFNTQPDLRRTEFISFIVPAWNEEAYLERTLLALRRAAMSLSIPYEMVVVDDGSTDRTAEIAAALGFQVVGGFDTTLYITEEISMSKRLKGYGCFVVLSDRVVTSARKLQSFSFSRSLQITFHAILGRSRFFRSRKCKELYCGQR